MTSDNQITREEDISLSVIDPNEVTPNFVAEEDEIEEDILDEESDEFLEESAESLAAKEQRKNRVIELIKEEWLDDDPELMKAVADAFDGRLDMD